MLTATRSTSFVESDLIRQGSEYAAMLPNARVSAEGALLKFTPISSPAETLNSAAYAMFDFIVPGYDREESVLLDWTEFPIDTSRLYFGLADWQGNRWDWFCCTDVARFDPGSFSPYFNGAGELLLTIVVTGADTWRLDHVRLGDQPAPADWQHSWGGSDDEELHGVATDAAGNVYCVGLTASYGAGETDCLILKFNQYGELLWARTWGGEENDQLDGIAVADNGQLYTCGRTYSFYTGPPYSDALLQCWSADGDLIWAKTWGYGNNDQAAGLALAGDELFVAGHSYLSSEQATDIAILKLDLAGNVLDARRVGNPNANLCYGFAADQLSPDVYEFYIAGHTWVSSTDITAACIKLSQDLEILQAREWQDATFAIVPQSIAVLDQPEKHVLLSFSCTLDGLDYHGGILEFSAAGPALGRYWSSGASTNIRLSGLCSIDAGKFLACGDIFESGVRRDALLAVIPATGSIELASAYAADQNYRSFRGLCSMPDQRVVLVGQTDPGAAGTWTSETLDSTSLTGSWQDVVFETGFLATLSFSAAASTGEINSGVLDSGGGGDDAIVCAKVLP